jgi:hypothetical protein
MQKNTPHHILPRREVEQNVRELLTLILEKNGPEVLVQILLNSIEPYATFTMRGIPFDYHLEENLYTYVQKNKLV